MSLYVIGNGFSINLVKKLEKKEQLQDRIDLSNLFSKGYLIPSTYGDGCYLSKNNCPNLWRLGVRCATDSKASAAIIGNIISSYVLYLKKCEYQRKYTPCKVFFDQNHESVKTYYELNRYLKKLFIFYDKEIVGSINKMDETDRNNFIQDVPFISDINKGDIVVSYNYDILLERLLTYVNKPYKYIFDTNDIDGDSVNIFKPHGSINFEASTNISNIYSLIPSEIEIIDMLEIEFCNSLIIPPTGFVVGEEGSWVREIREGISKALLFNVQEKVYIFGLSYDIVDREEINEILCCLDKNTTHVTYIDPNPSNSLDYIISQHFNLYCHKKP